MRGIWLVVLATSACGFSARAKLDDAGPPAHDAAPGTDVLDVPDAPDAPAGDACFGSLALDRVCYPAASVPGGSHTYQGAVTIDTDNAATCTGNANAVATLPGDPCIIAYASITLTSAQLTVGGSRPVIFLATGTAGISLDSASVISASSITGTIGAGALTSCVGGAAATQKGGGCGGSFLVLGGAGGPGSGDQPNAGGVPATALAMPAALHGGCPGGVGANNNFTTPTSGGGAVALVAQTLALGGGLIAAGGDGGYASNDDNAGGNGGGAGGMIVLDAVAITGGGELDAKGGGGGEGRGGNQPTSGAPGYYPANRFVESFGGSTFTSSGGDGGQGGPRITGIGTSANTGGNGGGGFSAAGGGGGGGAAGLITATSPLPPGITSTPSPQ